MLGNNFWYFCGCEIAASNVSQHATSFDDNKIVNDISTLANRQASNENKVAYNTQSMFVDVFQDASGIASNTNTPRILANMLFHLGKNPDVIFINSGGDNGTGTPINSINLVNNSSFMTTTHQMVLVQILNLNLLSLLF